MLKIYKTLIKNTKFILLKILNARLRKNKEDSARLHERMGQPRIARPDGPLIWVHAASVGESQSALSLIKQLLISNSSAYVLVTTGTLTSAALMQKQLPERALHQFYPLDHPDWVNGFLDHWRPDMALWIESELWPNMLGEVKARNIPAFLINARMSKKSFGRWRLMRGSARALLSVFSAVLAQTPLDAQRYEALGARNVRVTDNLKYNAKPLPADEDELAHLEGHMQGRLRWVFASTHKGEEELACRVHQTLQNSLPDLLTIIVPRHPERGEDIEQSCKAAGLRVTRRGEGKTPPGMDTNIYIADTLGELGLFYRLAPIACIGRSFSDDGGGGHNPIEAAQLNCAVLHGPAIQFQQEIYDQMNEAKAALVMADEAALAQTLHRLLTDKAALQEQQKYGLAFAKDKEGVLQRVMDVLQPHLEELKIHAP